jgi:VIT1/CCC1 family predicted Fe2+/Mn2+ transporter
MATTIDETRPPYQEHLGPRSLYLMLLLVVGVVGGGVDSEFVLLAGLAGAFAGAVSMAAGEYMATKSQEELIDAELALEIEHFKHYKDKELDEIREFLGDLGLGTDSTEAVVAEAAVDDDVLLGLMKAFEFGVIDEVRRNPYLAMATSGLLFLLGSAPSVVPFAFIDSPKASLAVAIVGAVIGLFVVGALKTLVTRKNPVRSGFENVAVAGVGAAVAYSIGLGYNALVN